MWIDSSSVLQRFNMTFLMLLCVTLLQGERKAVAVPILRKNCHPFSTFPFINTPSQMKICIYSTFPLFITTPLPARDHLSF